MYANMHTLAFGFFDHVERQIALAVTKAALLVTTIAILITAYVRVAVDLKFFSAISAAVKANAITQSAANTADWAFGISGALLLFALLLALAGTLPKINPNKTGGLEPEHKYGDNVLFYGFAAKCSPEEFAKNVADSSEEALVRDLLIQACGKSKWLQQMYARLQVATWCTAASLLIGTPAVVYVVVAARGLSQ